MTVIAVVPFQQQKTYMSMAQNYQPPKWIVFLLNMIISVGHWYHNLSHSHIALFGGSILLALTMCQYGEVEANVNVIKI